MSGWCKQWGDFCSNVVADGRETWTCFAVSGCVEMFASFEECRLSLDIFGHMCIIV